MVKVLDPRDPSWLAAFRVEAIDWRCFLSKGHTPAADRTAKTVACRALRISGVMRSPSSATTDSTSALPKPLTISKKIIH